MIVVYIGVPTLCVILIILWLSNQKDKKTRTQINHMLDMYGTRIQHMYHIGDEKFELHYFKLDKQSELVINSPKVWEIHQGSSSRLIHQAQLSTGPQKLIILYPNATPIKRYVNENEMVFVSHQHFFNNMYMVRLDELEIFLKGRTL